MVSPTQGDSEFVADLTSKRRGLRKAQVVSIGRTTAAHQTRFFGNCLDVSRMRRDVGKLSTVLSMAVRCRFLPRFAGDGVASSLASFESRTWKALSMQSASPGSKVFFATSA